MTDIPTEDSTIEDSGFQWSEDDLASAFAGVTGQGEETAEEEESQPSTETLTEEEEGAPPDSEPPAPEPQAPTPTDEVHLDGDLRLSRQEAQAWADFIRDARQNPRDVQAWLQYRQGLADFVPKDQPQPIPQVPEPVFDEFTDPNIKALYDRLSRLEQGIQSTLTQATSPIQQLEQRVRTFEEKAQAEQYANAEAIVRSAAAQFQKAHGLTDEELTNLRDQANRTGTVDQDLARQDPMKAALKTLDQVYWADEKNRDREFTRRQDQTKTDTKRQRKLAAVSGASGSVPRIQRKPQNRDEKIQQMADFLAASSGE